MKLNPGLTNIFLSIRPPNIANFLYVQLEKIAAPPKPNLNWRAWGWIYLFTVFIYFQQIKCFEINPKGGGAQLAPL